jgi:hypothetical protein
MTPITDITIVTCVLLYPIFDPPSSRLFRGREYSVPICHGAGRFCQTYDSDP